MRQIAVGDCAAWEFSFLTNMYAGLNLNGNFEAEGFHNCRQVRQKQGKSESKLSDLPG